MIEVNKTHLNPVVVLQVMNEGILDVKSTKLCFHPDLRMTLMITTSVFTGD